VTKETNAMSKTASTTPAEMPNSSRLSRRTVFAGAGAVGAAALAAAALPLAREAAPVVTAAVPESASGGYQLTEHVQRYYQTARV
jgi:hypothetical protein